MTGFDLEPPQDPGARPARVRIELDRADLDWCQAAARVRTVTLHFTNWPCTPSVPVTVLPAADEDGNIRFASGKKLHAGPRELTTVPRAGLEAGTVAGHPSRVFTPARMRQGFTSQAHLDAFYAYYDHVTAGEKAAAAGCGCGLPGPGHEGADGWQPSMTVCPAGQALADAEGKFLR